MAERSARADAEGRGITPEQVWEDREAHYPPGRVATPQEVADRFLSVGRVERRQRRSHSRRARERFVGPCSRNYPRKKRREDCNSSRRSFICEIGDRGVLHARSRQVTKGDFVIRRTSLARTDG